MGRDIPATQLEVLPELYVTQLRGSQDGRPVFDRIVEGRLNGFADIVDQNEVDVVVSRAAPRTDVGRTSSALSPPGSVAVTVTDAAPPATGLTVTRPPITDAVATPGSSEAAV